MEREHRDIPSGPGAEPVPDAVPPADREGGALAGDGEQREGGAASRSGGGPHGGFRSRKAPWPAVVALLVAGALAGAALTWACLSVRQPAGVTVARPVNVSAEALDAGAGTFSAVYEAVAPAVVGIEVSRSSQGWFGSGVEEGSGTGVIVDARGHVLTNYHVVQGADRVRVTLADGTTVEGKVAGTDPGNDLAVVKIDPAGHQLTVAVLGDSDRVRVGDVVVAIGNPFGLDRTLTVGVISGKDRQMTAVTGRTIRGLLQTDAALNPGNSGGPLLNLRGEVIGINTAIESPVRGSVGIGFAIPINTARRSLPVMVSGAQVEHPWLGIAGTAVTPEVAEQFGLGSLGSGVLVTEVMEGSPAEKAGLRPASVTPSGRTLAGDVITAVDGRAVASVDDIARYLETRRPGDRVVLTVLRDGKEIQLEATLGTWPDRLPGG